MIIENEYLKVEISTKGAEIHHLINKENGLEYMWDGNPQVWSGHNPFLFPVVGHTYPDGSYQIDGKTYKMANHGTVRNATFEVGEQSDTSITLFKESDQESLAVYPFPYRVSVTYHLEGNRLCLDYKVENTGDRPMPYSFGLHPAFKCPIEEGETFDEYHLEWDNEEILNVCDVTNGSFGHQSIATNRIVLDYKQLNATIILKDYQFESIRLTNGKHTVEMGTKGYPYIGFWTKNLESQYVCIEPWQGISDFTSNDLAFDKRPGTKTLEPGKVDTYTSWIELH